ncbi:glycosyltransferase family 2 protein [candidate division KSB1 bacterium]|nr:glycosyltransferase family 2 protein [candidate division KSB1 bacterium]
MSSNSENRTPTELSIVIPLLNEEGSLEPLYEEIRKTCEPLVSSFEMVFVDDGSTDGSFEILQKLHRKDDRVKIIQFRRNCGKADALAAGFLKCSGKLVVTMDADLQDDPGEIPNLIRKLDEGFDLVSGWKKKRKDPLSKRIPSKLYNRLTGRLTGLKLHDFNCGLKIYRREVVKSIRLYGQLHRYIPALAHLDGFRVGEMKVNHRPRQFGKSKYGFARATGVFDLVTILFLEKYMKRPLHLFGLVGFFSFIVGLGISGYLIVLRVLDLIDLSKRPLFMVGVLLTILGFQFISIGLLGEMIASKRQDEQRFSIKSSLGFD